MDDKEILFNRRVNYLIIEKLWISVKGKGFITDLHTLLKIDKNMYTRIRKANTYNVVNLERLWNQKDSGIKKLGLSKEIMTGEKMIEIEGIERKDWEEYWKYRDMEKTKDPVRINNMQYFNNKLNSALKKLSPNEPNKRDIDRLYYFIIYGRPADSGIQDIEMQDLKTSLNRIDIQKIKVCDNKLREEICMLLKERYEQINTVIQYNKLN